MATKLKININKNVANYKFGISKFDIPLNVVWQDANIFVTDEVGLVYLYVKNIGTTDVTRISKVINCLDGVNTCDILILNSVRVSECNIDVLPISTILAKPTGCLIYVLPNITAVYSCDIYTLINVEVV
jgi:hypothetical protein